MRQRLALLVLALAIPAATAMAQDRFGSMVLMSNSASNTLGRLCAGIPAGIGKLFDIHCPTYAPSITTAGGLVVSDTVTARQFIGDGSALTGVTAASGDRIVSGTTSMIAISNTGYISLTQNAGSGAANTGWFSPYTGLVTLGVSATGPISGSSGYFYNNVGIGTTAPQHLLTLHKGDSSYSNIQFTNADSGQGLSDALRLGLGSDENGYLYHGNYKALYLGTSNTVRIGISPNGNVGIGNGFGVPTATLQVSGSFVVSSTVSNLSPSLYVGTENNVGIGTVAASYAGRARLLMKGSSDRADLQLGTGAADGSAVTAATIAFDGGASAAGAENRVALLSAVTEGSTVGNRGGVLAFNTKANGANLLERMRINSEGNIGISKTNPIAKVDVAGDVSVSGMIDVGHTNQACSAGISGSIRFEAVSDTLQICTGDGWKSLVSSSTAGAVTAASSTGAIQFKSADGGLGGDTSNFFWDNANKRLGVGSSGPSSRLSVGGSEDQIYEVVSSTAYDPAGTGSSSAMIANDALVGGSGAFLLLSARDSGNRANIGYMGAVSTEGTRTPALVFGQRTASTAYAERMRLNPSGNLGIGTSSPAATLQVSGSFTVSTSTQTTTPTLYAGTNGNVGIGTSAPANPLHVYTTNNAARAAVIENNASSGSPEGLLVVTNQNGGAAPKLAVGTGTASSYATNFIVTNAGNVGIGTATPGSLLHVSGTGSAAHIDQRIENTMTNGWSTLWLGSTNEGMLSGGSTASAWTNQLVLVTSLNTKPIVFAPAAVEQMRISNLGVGIGTATIGSSLTVAGEAQVGSTGVACVTASRAGAIRYTGGNLQYCNGSNTWTTLGAAGAATAASSTGAVQFNVANGLAGDTSNFFWDDTNNRLGLGTNVPSYPFEVSTTNGQGMVLKGPPSTWKSLNFFTNATRYGLVGVNTSDQLALYSEGALIFYTGAGNPRMFVDAAGNVGVGTVTPTSTLQVSGTFVVSVTGQITTPTLYVGTNGRVGIGTSSPASPLSVHAGMSSFGMALYNGNGGLSGAFYNGNDGRGLIYLYDSAGNAKARIGTNEATYFTGGNVGISNTTPLAKLDVVGDISVSGIIDVGHTNLACSSTISGSIRFEAVSDTLQICTSSGWKSLVSSSVAAGATTAASSTGAVQFNVANALAGDTANFFWDDTNNRLGIGNSAVSASLQVSGGSSVPALRLSSPGGVNGSPQLLLEDSLQAAASTPFYYFKTYGGQLDIGNANRSATNLTTSSNVRLTMLASGNVGLGTVTPTATLQVSGTFTVSNTAQAYDAPSVYVGSDGNVGIGTTSDAARRLVVNGGTGTAALFRGRANDTGAVAVYSGSSTGMAQHIFSVFRDSPLTDTNRLMTVTRNNTVGFGLGLGSPTATLQVSGTFTVSTTSAPNSPSLYVAADGKVGLGTSSPTGALEVRGGTGGTGGVQSYFSSYAGWGAPTANTAAISSGSKIVLWDAANQKIQLGMDGNADMWFSNAGGQAAAGFTFYLGNGSGVTPTAALKITKAGLVGVSNIAPLANLDVAGTISASDAIQVGTSSLTCSSAIKGAMRYSNTSSTIEYCNSTAWTSLGPSATVAYVIKTNSTVQNSVAVNTVVGFDTVAGSYGSDISASGNRITLAPGAMYRLDTVFRCNGSTGIADYKFYDVTNGGYIGSAGSCNPSTSSAYTDVMASAFVAPTAATSYEVRIIGLAGTVNVVGGHYGTFSAFKLGGGGGSGGGASTLNDLTDVDTTGVATGKVIAYNGTNWVVSDSGGVLGDSVSVTTLNSRYLSSTQGYIGALTGGTAAVGGLTVTGASSLSNVSITNLLQTGMSAQGCTTGISGSIRYNNTSDTLQICTSGGWKSLVSGTTGGGSADNLGNHTATQDLAMGVYKIIGTGQVSVTNISASVGTFVGAAITGVAGPGGNFIASGTTSVSASSAGSIKFSTADSQRMVITPAGAVGIGVAAPARTLDINGDIQASGYPDFNYGEIEIQGTQGVKAPFVRFHRPSEEYGQIRYGTDSTNDGYFHFRNINNANYANIAAATVSATTIIAAPPMMIVADEKASGTAGGTCTSGSWFTRTLNTVWDNSITGASLSSDQFTLPAGKYIIRGRSPGVATNRLQARLYNVTDAAVSKYGSNGYGSQTAPNTQTESVITAIVTISASKSFRIEHQCNTTKATNGLGIEGSFGGVEIYTTVEITKLQ